MVLMEGNLLNERDMKIIDKSLLEEAYKICLTAHSGQFDKGGSPYCYHPIRVSKKCYSLEAKIVALLHDIIEDTSISLDHLLSIFPDKIVVAVQAISKMKEEDYFEFIKRCSLTPIAREVKIKDLEDNMDLSRLHVITEKDLKRLDKYKKAHDYLINL